MSVSTTAAVDDHALSGDPHARPSTLEQDRAPADSSLHPLHSPSSTAKPTTPTPAAQQPTGASHDAAAGPSPRQPPGRMRSSIACIRCRRSKVKCVNNGVGTTCRSCENSGRECQYPSPVSAGARRRDSVSGRADPTTYGDAERRQRPRKSTHTFVANPLSAPRDSPRPLLDALDSRLLTAHVWQELFDIFQIHYSADLPFLHPPSFLKPLRSQNGVQAAPNGTSEEPLAPARPPASTEFLLAFLALTARFHPKLVAHHSPPTATRPSNPLIASEYYAAAANQRMATLWTDNRSNDIEWTQATLMLGLHEWGMCRGAKAWLSIGMAIRTAQAIGLQYELDLDDEPLSRSLALSGEAERMGMSSQSGRKNSLGGESAEDVFIQQEIRRRTFWSCYIMDRYLSSGKYRPQMLHARELRIQLPASERSFLFAEKVRTLMLGEEDKNISGPGRAEVRSQRQQSVMLGTAGTPEPSMAPSPRSISMRDVDEEKGRLEVGADEGLVSRYVKILEIYGKVIKWSCAGGRRVEEHPPWDSRCEFARLRRQCQDFKASLPRQHALTPQNTQAHISLKTSTPYTLVHTVYLLCQIMLHREYVPFIPIRCSKPQGPLDPPTFPPEKYQVPPGFWEESARECFRSAREIMDLVQTCQEWNALVGTPIVGFAIYTVAFVGVYCINFPWMDPEGYMCTRPEPNAKLDTARPGESKGFEAARKALEMISNMRPRLHMADGWFKTINRMHKYFRRLKQDYRKNIQAIESSSESDSPVSTRHLSLREGGSGGGLDEYRILERTLTEFGNLEDHDIEMSDPGQHDSRHLDAMYDDSSAETTVKSEDPGERHDRVTSAAEPPRSQPGSWSAINAAPAASQPSRHASIPTPTSGQFRSYEPYSAHHHHHHSQQQQPPTPQPGQRLEDQERHQQQQAQQQQAHQGYAPSINNFRHTYPTPGSAGAPPSLTSPPAQSAAAASTPSQAQPSPPYDRPQPSYAGWSGHQSPYAGQMPAPQHAYTNGISPPPPQQHPTGYTYQHQHTGSTSVHQLHPQSSYPPMSQPPPSQYQQQQHYKPPPPPAMADPQQHMWDPTTKEAWLNSIDTRLGGDDVAAFVDGGELAEWANMAAAQGFGGGWLSTVWGGRSVQ